MSLCSNNENINIQIEDIQDYQFENPRTFKQLIYTKSDLIQLCSDHKLKQTGTISVLIKRLLEYKDIDISTKNILTLQIKTKSELILYGLQYNIKLNKRNSKQEMVTLLLNIKEKEIEEINSINIFETKVIVNKEISNLELNELKLRYIINDLENIIIKKTGYGQTQKQSQLQTNAVINILKYHGFKHIEKTYLNHNYKLYFISQPNGTQKFPDFKLGICKNGKILFINLELKLGYGKIMWNDGFPNNNETIYLFSCTKSYKTKLFTMAIFNNIVLNRYKEMCIDLKLLNEKFKNYKKQDNVNDYSKFSFYARKAINHSFSLYKLCDFQNVLNIFSILIY